MSFFRRVEPPVLAVALVLLLIASAAAGRPLDDLMMDLQVAPLDPRPAPPLSATTLDGARVSLADLKGQAVLVYFWATW